MFSLNKIVKNILILMALLLVFVLPVSAFTDNFDSGTIDPSWVVHGGTWSAATFDMRGTIATSVTSSINVTRSISNVSDISFRAKSSGTYVGGTGQACRSEQWGFGNNTSKYYIQLSTNTVFCGGLLNTFTSNLPGFTPYAPDGDWHRIIFHLDGSNIRVMIYNSSEYLVTDQYLAYTPIDYEYIYFSESVFDDGGTNQMLSSTVYVDEVAVDSIFTGSIHWSASSYVPSGSALLSVDTELTNPNFDRYKYYVVVSKPDDPIYNQYNIYDTVYSQNYILESPQKLTASLYYLDLSLGMWADAVLVGSDEIIPLGVSGEPFLSGNDISWWLPAYTLGSSGNISYLYESEEFGFLENPYIRISKNGVVLREYPTDFGVVSRNGGKLSYYFPEVGEYIVSLGKKSFLGSFQELKTSTTVVSISTGSLVVASSVPTNNPFNVTYTSSLGMSSSQDRVIKLYYYSSGSLEFLTEYFFSGISPSGVTQFKVTKPGNYYMKLLDLASGEMVLDAVDFSAYASTSLPTGNYTSSNISLIKSTWAADEILSGDYYIHSDYYRNSTIYFNFTGTSSKCIPLSDHGRFNCLVYLPAGPNVIHMIAQNGSILTELANYTFTVSLLTTTGYRLSVFPDRLNIGEQYTVSIISPSNSLLNVTYNGVNGEALNELLSSSPINGSMSFTKTASKRGYYTFELLDDNSNVVMIQSLTVIDPSIIENGTGRPVEYPPIPSGRDAGAGIIDTLLGFMTLPIFWGVLFLGVCLYYLRNSSGLILPVLFIMINIEAVVGLLDPYGTYIVIMTWLVMAIFFIFVQRKTTG